MEELRLGELEAALDAWDTHQKISVEIWRAAVLVLLIGAAFFVGFSIGVGGRL
jgi:hypothetical protein